jgi:hypothetical protein
LEAVQILKMRDKLGSNYARALEKAFNEFEARKKLKENTNQACTSFTNENHDYHQVNIAAQVQSPIKTPVLHVRIGSEWMGFGGICVFKIPKT